MDPEPEPESEPKIFEVGTGTGTTKIVMVPQELLTPQKFKSNLVVEKFPYAEMVRLHAVVGPRMRQEDVLQKHQLLRQQLDTLLQLFILLRKHKRYYKFIGKMNITST